MLHAPPADGLLLLLLLLRQMADVIEEAAGNCHTAPRCSHLVVGGVKDGDDYDDNDISPMRSFHDDVKGMIKGSRVIIIIM